MKAKKLRGYKAEYQERKSRENNARLVRKAETATDRATKGVEADFSRPSLMSPIRGINTPQKTAKLLKEFQNKELQLQEAFLSYELQAERLASESKGSLLLTPITLHLDSQAMQSLYATARERNKAIATLLHKRLSDSLSYYLKRNVVFHLAFGIAYSKDRALAKGERIPLYHVHITALLTPKEANSHTREGKKAHRAFKCLNKLPKTKEFIKQECHFSTPSQQEVFSHEYANYKDFGSRQRWSEYKLKNAREALIRDKNNYFNKLSDLEAGSRQLKLIKNAPPVNESQNSSKDIPETTNAPPASNLPPHIQALREELKQNPEIGEQRLSDSHKEVLEKWRESAPTAATKEATQDLKSTAYSET